MKNEKFLFKVRRDFAPEPKDFSITKISCFDFFNSTNSFIERNFTGALHIEYPDIAKGYVQISPYGFAYFIRLLLSEIYGDGLTVARVFADDKELTVEINSPKPLKREKQLENVAARSGFSVSIENGKITLRTKLHISCEVFVYADDMMRFINYYYEVFLMQENE